MAADQRLYFQFMDSTIPLLPYYEISLSRHLLCGGVVPGQTPKAQILVIYPLSTHEPRHGKTDFCICENKDADQLRGYREADQRLVFTTRIVQSLNFLNPKFQASSHLL